jgi:stage V sporulation protein SpoVS
MMDKVEEVRELKVSGHTHPNKLGGAISNYLEEEGEVVVTGMGKDAVNQMVKGVIVGKSNLASMAKSVDIDMGFKNRHDDVDGSAVTVIAFYLTLN